MRKSHNEISLPISSTNYRKPLPDVVNYFETLIEKPTPPKLTSYRRLPSVTDVYSEKDTASDSEVTGTIKKPHLFPSPAAPRRLLYTGLETPT
jgi:hypothetical protein